MIPLRKDIKSSNGANGGAWCNLTYNYAVNAGLISPPTLGSLLGAVLGKCLQMDRPPLAPQRPTCRLSLVPIRNDKPSALQTDPGRNQPHVVYSV